MTAVPRVLVIDDEESMRDSCRQVLVKQGYSVETAGDGAYGLELLKSVKPDLALLDLKMAGLSGMEVLEAVREIDPLLVTVVITGYATIESAIEAFKRGAYDFLPKPFTPDELRIVVARGLEKRRLHLEMVRLQEEKERMRRLFTAMVSHQLRAPLATIQQNLEAVLGLAAGDLTEKQGSLLSAMRRQIDGLLGLTRDWLELSRLENTGPEAFSGDVCLAGVVSDAMEMARPRADTRGVSLRSDVGGNVAVAGDRECLRQLFANLIDNGVKYNRRGGEVVVAAKQNGSYVEIMVSDTGMGIEAADLPFIFDEFRRAGGAGSVEGTGLGLAIASRIVKAHSGTIRVESEAGKGSTFFVRLPKPGGNG